MTYPSFFSFSLILSYLSLSAAAISNDLGVRPFYGLFSVSRPPALKKKPLKRYSHKNNCPNLLSRSIYQGLEKRDLSFLSLGEAEETSTVLQ